MHESEIIALFFENGSDRWSELPRDDCARVNARTIVTTDAIVEGTHFRREWSEPEDLAIKLWNVNLSDIAASGGEARWCLLNLGLPADIPDGWTRRFAASFRAACAADGGQLVGGDTFRSERVTLSLTLAGELDRLSQTGDANTDATESENDESYRYISREGARSGDAVYVSGTLGLSQLGFEILSGDRPAIRPDQSQIAALHVAAVDRHLRPRARLRWSRELRSKPELSTLMDLSDGLYPDLLRLAAANPALDFEIEYNTLPHFGRSPSARTADTAPAGAATVSDELLPAVRALQAAGVLTENDISSLALSSGEELELLFTARPGMRFGFPCSEIGRVVNARAEAPPNERVRLSNAPFERPPQWFQHF